MPEELLKEQLMGYAHDGAEHAVQPGAADIRRRARRHAQRLAALTVAGVVAAGLGIGIGLRRDHATPTVDQPRPPVTSPAPVVKPPATTPTPAPAGKPHPATTNPVAAGPPASFVTIVGPAFSDAGPARVAVVSTSSGQIVRYLTGPTPAGAWLTGPAIGPDRAFAYYSLNGVGGRTGTYRVPFAGGPATRLTGTVGASLAVSPDGSRLLLDAMAGSKARYGLVVLDLASGRERFLPYPFKQAGDIFGYAWSPDGRQVALVRGPILDSETFPVQLFVLDVAAGRWRTAASFAASGPVPEPGQLGLAWPAPGRVAFVARFAGSDREPGHYRLVDVDPQTGKLTASAVVLATDPTPNRRVGVGHLELDASGRHLLYAVEGTFLRTSWVDLSGRRARVIVGQFNALDPKETHAYKAGAW